jgi:hypothetical protein
MANSGQRQPTNRTPATDDDPNARLCLNVWRCHPQCAAPHAPSRAHCTQVETPDATAPISPKAVFLPPPLAARVRIVHTAHAVRHGVLRSTHRMLMQRRMVFSASARRPWQRCRVARVLRLRATARCSLPSSRSLMPSPRLHASSPSLYLHPRPTRTGHSAPSGGCSPTLTPACHSSFVQHACVCARRGHVRRTATISIISPRAHWRGPTACQSGGIWDTALLSGCTSHPSRNLRCLSGTKEPQRCVLQS